MNNSVSQLRKVAKENLRIPGALHEYQWNGISFLYKSKCALLADEMGLGKTVQAAIALSLLLRRQNEINRALIVAPASLTFNWMSELQKWTPSLVARRLHGSGKNREAFYQLPIPVLVASYEQIRQDGLDRIPSNTFDLVILDEAQRIKNRHSKTALACRLLPRQWSWALSATPLENKKDDLESILGFLNPNITFDSSKSQLKEILERIMLRRYKKEVRSELPEVISQDLHLELTKSQRDAYDNLWFDRTSHIKGKVSATTLLSLITRLKIICNYEDSTNESSKIDALLSICESAGDSARIVIFSQFVKTLKRIAEHINVPYGLFTGSMPEHERQQSMSRFKSDTTPRLLLVSIMAGGVGLNLGEATHVVMFDRWWNPAVENQAIYRAHRFEREEPLHVIRFLVKDTIEEHIVDILERKSLLFKNVVDSAVSASDKMTVRDMLKILELPSDNIHFG